MRKQSVGFEDALKMPQKKEKNNNGRFQKKIKIAIRRKIINSVIK
jgi:hypothetical protein